PTRSTTPTPSCPSTMGKGASRPACACKSVWQMPAATTRTPSSPARGASRFKVSNAGAVLPGRLTAARIFMAGDASRARPGGRRRRNLGARPQLQLALPGHLLHLRPGVDVQRLEQPAPLLARHDVVARADAEHEIGAVLDVEL